MAVENSYNPNPSTVDSLLRQRQVRADLTRESGSVPVAPAPQAPTPPKILGVNITPNYEDKSFGRKVGEDAAMLAYAIPVGLAKVASGLLTHPIDTSKELVKGFGQSLKDTVDPDYYKAHPLLGAVNLAGFITPIAGAAKSIALKTAMRTALETGVKEAVNLGVEESAARAALTTGVKEAGGFMYKKGAMGEAVWEAGKTGKVELVGEVAKELLKKSGIADDTALRISNEISNNLYSTLSRQTTKMKTLEAIAHPIKYGAEQFGKTADPLRQALFGNPAETAVGKLYGADVVGKNPEGFAGIERWASAQVRERGLEDSVINRQRVMQEWVDNNSQWASLNPEQRVAHFKNYAEQDLKRLAIHNATGMDIVSVKALPQNYVDAMVQTIKDAPADIEIPELMKMMDDAFGKDFTNHSADITAAIAQNPTKEGMIQAVSKLGNSRSAISFQKFSPEVQSLASELEKTGYRIGHAPKSKEVSYATDVFAGGAKKGVEYFRGVGKDGGTHGYAQLGKGKYVSSDMEVAKFYAKDGGTIEKYNLADGLNLIKDDSPEFRKLYNQLAREEGDLTSRLTEELKKRGYDGVDGTISGDSQFAKKRNQVVVFDENNLVPVKAASEAELGNLLTKRTALGNWVDKLGLSPNGLVEGAVEYSYRENFTQRALDVLGKKFGNTVQIDKVSVPVEKLFEWLDKNRDKINQLRPKFDRFLPIRTVFDMTENDLIRAGIKADVAKEIIAVSKSALREVPASLTGMGDAVVNYMRTSNKGFGKWMSDWYSKYLQTAYKGRYDWSPFFGAQQFLETQINSSLLLKDGRAFLPYGGALTKLGDWTADKLGVKLLETKSFLKEVVKEPLLEEVAMVKNEILGTLQKTMLDVSNPDLMQIRNTALGTIKDKAAFQDAIRSKNIFYSVFGHSSVKMATTFSKGIAHKFGMTLEEALSYTVENGVKQYKNPQMVQMMREMTQAAYHYQPGVLTSPLMKTLNLVWFPMRFQAKTAQLAANWLNSLSPASRMVMLNNWVHFANWAGTDEGIKWRRTNKNYLYNIFTYTTAYEQMGQAAEAVTKGRLFGGNAGLIGGVPFGFLANVARELAILPSDPDQFDPKTGARFLKTTPRKVVSAASLSTAIEQLLISISPSTPFYSLTGGAISGISPSKQIQSLVRQVVGDVREGIEGRDSTKGKQMLERDFKKVPLEYTRLSE